MVSITEKEPLIVLIKACMSESGTVDIVKVMGERFTQMEMYMMGTGREIDGTGKEC